MAFAEQRYRIGSDVDEYGQDSMNSPMGMIESDSGSDRSDDLDSERLSFPPDHDQISLITDWSREECADFISSIRMGQYSGTFIDQEITGESIISLNHADLKEMGINSLGHRLTILKSIYDIKVKHSVPMNQEDFVPPSVTMEAQDQPATHDEITRIIRILKERDDRLSKLEAKNTFLQDELTRLGDENQKLRQEIIPMMRMAKEKSMMPMPETQYARGPLTSLSQKFPSKLTLNPLMAPHTASPTPSKSAYDDSNYTTPLMSGSGIRGSPARSPSVLQHQPSPTSPAHPGRTVWSDQGPSSAHSIHADTHSPSQATTPTTGNSQGTSGSANNEIFHSFRVAIDDPCHKVLPLALKRYGIKDHWRQYALYIVHGAEGKRVERCLRLHEKPLTLFKQLDKEGRRPMFMLRRLASPDSKALTPVE